MPIDLKKVSALIELVKSSGVTEVEIHEGSDSVRVSIQTNVPAPVTVAMPPAPPPTTPASPVTNESPVACAVPGHTVKSPMVGTVYLASTPGAKPFVEMGQTVSVGDVLCIIEAMKMMNQIEADKAGVVRARLVENAQAVEFGQALFVIE